MIIQNNGLKDFLNLTPPKIKNVQLEQFATECDYNIRLFLAVDEACKKFSHSKQLEDSLKKDKRVKRLQNKLISTGLGSASIFDVKNLTQWFVYYANKYGSKKAVRILDDYLSSNQIAYLATEWIVGIEATKKIKLAQGVELVPINLMPDSSDKENFMQFNTKPIINRSAKPRVALVVYAKGPKINHFGGKELKTISESLYSTSLLLNLIPELTCMSYFRTSYLLDSVPPGPFSGSGGMGYVMDIVGTHRMTTATPQMISKNNFSGLYQAFAKLKDKERERWELILSRLGQAKRRINLADRILDLGIALEMALLKEPSDKRQLSLDFRLRGSRIIISDPKERMKIYNELRDIYNFRSRVAHNGFLSQEEQQKLERKIQDYEILASRICSYLLLNNDKIDWNKILLS